MKKIILLLIAINSLSLLSLKAQTNYANLLTNPTQEIAEGDLDKFVFDMPEGCQTIKVTGNCCYNLFLRKEKNLLEGEIIHFLKKKNEKELIYESRNSDFKTKTIIIMNNYGVSLSSQANESFFEKSNEKINFITYVEKAGPQALNMKIEEALASLKSCSTDNLDLEENSNPRSSSSLEEITSNNTSLNPITIQPNPADDLVFLKRNSNSISFIKIINITGKVVFTQDLSDVGEELEVNVSTFPRGIYFIEAFDKNRNIFTQKLILKSPLF